MAGTRGITLGDAATDDAGAPTGVGANGRGEAGDGNAEGEAVETGAEGGTAENGAEGDGERLRCGGGGGLERNAPG